MERQKTTEGVGKIKEVETSADSLLLLRSSRSSSPLKQNYKEGGVRKHKQDAPRENRTLESSKECFRTTVEEKKGSWTTT